MIFYFMKYRKGNRQKLAVMIYLLDNLIGYRTSSAFLRARALPTLQKCGFQGSCLETEVSKQIYCRRGRDFMPKLLYQGHGSYRLSGDDGRVIYVDPYAGDGYDLPADIILVTHQHDDHNKVEKCRQKQGCRIITNAEAVVDGRHNSFDVDGISIQAVEARNIMHNPKDCVGYIITIGTVKIYASGDTSKTEQMKTFAGLGLDYAIFCGDGIFNMGLKEAAECAKLIGAKHNIIIHLKPGVLFDRKKAEKWDAPDKLIVEPGQEIEL